MLVTLVSFFFTSSVLAAYNQTQSDIEKKIYLVEHGLKTGIEVKNQAIRMNILDRMNYYKIPSVSLAIINHGKIEWAKTYNINNEEILTPKTLFQAASISKPFTAIVALSLVESNKLSLDRNVNDMLSTWKVPDNKYTEIEKVTLRRLLSHTAGLTVHGFEGYSSSLTEQDLPSIIQILNGEKPANSPRVEPNNIPGTAYSYSGGGYIVAQKMMEEVTQAKFSDLVHKIVFNPIKMESSTFELIWPTNTNRSIATGHLKDGTPVKGAWNLYPETAPAGLWSTPSDLARFVIDIQNTFEGKSEKIISTKMMQQMLTPQPNSHMGLGFKLKQLNKHIIEFSHGGSNVGYKADLVGFTKTGQGVVIMTNADRGTKILPEIERSVADTYHWPQGYTDQYKIVQPVTIDPAIYQNYVGKFEIDDAQLSEPDIIILSINNNKLFVTLPFPAHENKIFELTPESETEFFNVAGDFELSFTPGNNNELTIAGMKAHRLIVTAAAQVGVEG